MGCRSANGDGSRSCGGVSDVSGVSGSRCHNTIPPRGGCTTEPNWPHCITLVITHYAVRPTLLHATNYGSHVLYLPHLWCRLADRLRASVHYSASGRLHRTDARFNIFSSLAIRSIFYSVDCTSMNPALKGSRPCDRGLSWSAIRECQFSIQSETRRGVSRGRPRLAVGALESRP